MTTAIRVLIVDDHPVVRSGLTSMLETVPSLEIAGVTAGGADALALLSDTPVDVMLLDLRMPGMSGLDVLKSMSRQRSHVRSIILSTYEMDEDIYRAVQAGARGYLIKSTSQDEIVKAIRDVHAGNLYLPPRIARRLTERISRPDLTRREIEILEMMTKGLTNKEIGKVFNISENTARNHVNSIIQKLEAADRTEAATTAILRGIVHLDG